MFDDYKEKVILAYQKKRKANAISINLLRPSPGKLKTECLNVYGERRLKKDEKIFRSFFGSIDNATDYGQNIKAFDIDKFRPLINFLNGKTTDPEEKNIELLAWLIDFEPRPYQFGYNYKEDVKSESTVESFDNPEKIEDDINGISPITQNDEKDSFVNRLPGEEERLNDEIEKVETIAWKLQPASGQINWSKKTISRSKIKNAIFSFMVIVTASSGAYLFMSNKNQECMYWTGDHYQPISCNQKVGDTSVIALDTTKVAHLKKITHPDTLTKNCLGKVWYVKTDDGLEFYTSDGFHPIYNEKRLRPVTMYILNKYIIRN
ncbi:hypothetical protein H7F33_10430 [Pedobacter sp. PAMC26386]|nr:hypothetical protein H7F33_10430 [Pedobacter sp. PAMC26386]